MVQLNILSRFLIGRGESFVIKCIIYSSESQYQYQSQTQTQ